MRGRVKRFIDYYTFRLFYFNGSGPIVRVKWVVLLLRIRNVSGSNLGSKTAFAGWQLLLFSSVRLLNVAKYLKQAKAASLHVFSSLFTVWYVPYFLH
jgi:hypothetical protein